MNYPGVVFWGLIAWSITARLGTVMVLLLASMPFARLGTASDGSCSWNVALASDDVCSCSDSQVACPSIASCVGKTDDRFTASPSRLPGSKMSLCLDRTLPILTSEILPCVLPKRDARSRSSKRFLQAKHQAIRSQQAIATPASALLNASAIIRVVRT